ncbi:sensory box histidine kinase/response regulator [Fimbriiglobus ruber]|uniref:histidine kinase n=1 Tax=Fimbriiglobus ruber TaxID=1908690 RepID=A0A225D3G5_9BACT|nr:sensory box histidine kinase/response regulator [Fimbriiglobus ruber]
MLIVKSSLADADVMLLALRRDGVDPVWERVETTDALQAALAAGVWDVVLSDYTIAELGSPAALEIVRASDPDLPFIIVLGTVGEDVAVALMRATVNDCILKHNLSQLAATVDREVRQAGSRRANRAIARTAAHLAAVVESSDNAILSKTLDGVLTSWNLAAERLYGWTAAEAIGRNISFLVPRDKTDEWTEIMLQLQAGQQVKHFETVRLHRDGRRLDVMLTVSPVRDTGGGLVGVSKSSHDIQERKRAEGALRRSEERYRGLIESIPALVSVYDATGRPLQHNRRWYEYTGQSSEATAGTLWHEAIHPDDAVGAVVGWDRCKASGEAYSTEYRLRRGDGEYRWFLVQGVAQGDRDGIKEWVRTCTDIDDRKRAEDTLRQTADLLTAVAEGTPDAVFVKDRDGQYLLCNSAASQFLRRPSADILGHTDTEFFDPASAQWVISRDHRVMTSGVTETEEGELTVAGVTRTIQGTKAPYRDAVGNVIGVIGISRDITGQKRAAESLSASETQYRRLFEAAQDGILIVDVASRRVVDANPFLTNLLGYRLEELVGKELWEIGLFRDIEANKAAFQTLLEQGYIRYKDHPLLTKDRAQIEVEFVSNVYDVGNSRVIQCNIRDITERARAEAAVRQSEERFRAFMDHSPAAAFIKDEDGRFLYVNPTWRQQFDPEPVAWQGKSDHDFWPRETADLFRASDGECLARNAVVQTEETARTAAGTELTWLVMKFPIDDGGEMRIGGMAWDITARKRTEDDLHLRDRAIRAATQGLLITDPNKPDNPIVYVSPGFERITGYASDEVLGCNCRFLQGADTDPVAVARLREAVRDAKSCSVELLNYRKDGTPFWNELSISPVRDEVGCLTHFVGVQADATGRRSLEEQFRQVQKMEAVGQLAAGVAHDFNNLLTIINGYSEILLQGLPSDDPFRDMVTEIFKAGERSAGLTRQLLAFSRRQVLTPRILVLNGVVADTNKMLRRLIGADVRLTTTLDRGLGAVRADSGQIEQVLMNLAVNARDAMPRGGVLTIETRNVELDDAYARAHPDARPGPYVLLGVSDTGCGMSPEVRARIFEPFFTTKGAGKGTGLGLATVYGIVQQSGGHIMVDSEVGVGSTFKVYLPRVNLVAENTKAHPGAGTPPRGTETVLIAEDDDGVRALIVRVLAHNGYTVLEAADGDEAVRLSSAHVGSIHLLVTDVVMPGAGGRSVAEQVAERHPESRVLFVSGYTDDAVIRHGVLREGVNFLQKPYSPVALMFKVREVLDGAR